MPRRSKGARLQLKGERRDNNGRVTHHATWIIRDNGKDVATGCHASEVEKAEQKLKGYITDKYNPTRRLQDIERIPVSDVLSIFVDDRPDLYVTGPGATQYVQRMARLNEWWGAKMLSEVTGETCRAYQRHRGNLGGARRDMEDMRAAIGHHVSEGLHRGIVKVVLPKKGDPRDRWLLRVEAAKLIRTCWRYQEIQTVHRGERTGEPVSTRKHPLRHLARFILIGLYTGTRAGAIAAASPSPAKGRSYVDLDQGIFYRLPEGNVKTNKRQPPVPLPPRLLAHMRRWQERGLIRSHFVEFNGLPVRSVKTAFKRAVRLAGIAGKVSPHTLRHTAATWLMQNGADRWQAAGYLGMSVEMLENVYGHHSPDHLQNAVVAIGKRGQTKPEQTQIVSGAVTGAVAKSAKPSR